MGTQKAAAPQYPEATVVGAPIAATAPTPAYNPSAASAPTQSSAGGFGRAPVITICPNCKNQTQTRCEQHVTIFTLGIMVVLFYFAWPLCWIPIFLPDLKSIEHYCRRCNFRLAKKKYPWTKSKAY